MILKIAWRNIWRNLRRSIITLGAITFGLASVIIFFGITDGFHVQMIDYMVKTSSGHVVVHKEGYNDDPKVTNSMDDTTPIINKIKTMAEVTAYSERIEVSGLASTPENSVGVLIRGINPDDETKITEIKKRIIEGSYLDSSDPMGILIGRKMKKKLDAELGSKLVLMVQAIDGSIGAELFRVKGVFRMGSAVLDSSFVLINTEGARNLTSLTSGSNAIAMLVEGETNIPIVTATLKESFEPTDHEILTWREVMPELEEMIEMDDIFMYLMLIIIMTVVSLGILNTMLMSIMERTREFGVMMALGTKPGQIVHLVMAEAGFLAFIGTVLGITLGITVNALLSINGIDFSEYSDAFEFVGMVTPIVYPETEMRNIVASGLIVFVTTVIVSIYPSVKASRQKPVEAIRHI